jgi:hypothetical protein
MLMQPTTFISMEPPLTATATLEATFPDGQPFNPANLSEDRIELSILRSTPGIPPNLFHVLSK